MSRPETCGFSGGDADCLGCGQPLSTRPKGGCHLEEREKQAFVHITPTPKKCDHEWSNDGTNQTDVNSEYCLKCGMSFWRYTFTECP